MVLIACSSQVCNAQSLFKLHAYSSVTHNDNDYMPLDTYVFDFKKTTGYLFKTTYHKYIIDCPDVCRLCLSDDLVYTETEYDTMIIYSLWDTSSVDDEGYYNKGIKYAKRKNCSQENLCKAIFIIVDGDDTYSLVNSVIYYILPNNTSSLLSARTIDEDQFISFMRSFKK